MWEGALKGPIERTDIRSSQHRMAFDALSRWGAWMAKAGPSVRATGASFRWGIDGPRDILHLEPRLELVTEMRTPYLPGYSKLPWAMRALVRVMDPIPALRRLNRLLLYQF